LALIYNYEYYPEHLKKLGYEKEIDWLEYEIQVPEKPIEKISKAAGIVLKRNNLHILEVSQKKDLLKYSKELFYLLDDEYSHLFGTVPLSEKQMETYIKQYFGFISSEFVPVVLDENNKMIAFGIVMPSLSIALQKSKGRLFPFGWYHLLRALKKNKVVWYAPDQDFGRRTSVFAKFFGINAATIPATARLAKMSGTSIVPYVPRRLANGNYSIDIGPAWENYPSGDELADAQRVNDWVEAEIRKSPMQYLWVHRRFKTQPEGKGLFYKKLSD